MHVNIDTQKAKTAKKIMIVTKEIASKCIVFSISTLSLGLCPAFLNLF